MEYLPVGVKTIDFSLVILYPVRLVDSFHLDGNKTFANKFV
jgi:hypothetical protein